MTDMVLFHHVQGLTAGVTGFADELRIAGHTVYTPDLFDGLTFDSIDEGMAHIRQVGFDEVIARAEAAVADLPPFTVYAGFSMGVLPAQKLAQTRAGARGALLFHSCVPTSEFGAWPADVAVQIHSTEADPFFVGEGDIEAARALLDEAPDAELFLYPGNEHLFADHSLPSYVPDSAALLRERTLAFLARIG